MMFWFLMLGFNAVVICFNYNAINHSLRVSKTEGDKTRIALALTDTLFDSFQPYQFALENDGLLTDMITCGCIYTVSDSIAQFLSLGEKSSTDEGKDGYCGIVTESMPESAQSSLLGKSISLDVPLSVFYDVPRTIRLASFGLADGAISHWWFIVLDYVVGEGQGLTNTLFKTAADALVYTPLWCGWFLAFMTAIEPLSGGINSDSMARIRSIPDVWRSDWFELVQGNIGFFLPITGLVYGLIPREELVLVFGVASLIYTTLLSLWNKNRQNDKSGVNDVLPVVNLELCDIGGEYNNNEECVTVPTPSRFV